MTESTFPATFGQTPRPDPGPQEPRRRIAFPIAGALAVAGALVAAVIASSVTDWGHSVCNVPIGELGRERRALRQSYLGIWLLAAGVPLWFALLARSKQRRSWPWAVIAGGFVVIALTSAATAQPSTLCVF